MAYMNQERKKIVAEILKPVLKKYSIKGSLAVRNHSTLVLNIKAGSIDFIENFNKTIEKRPGGFRNGSPAEKYISINPYWFQEHFSGKAKAFLTESMKALKSAGWYDKSDAQVDYFDTAYYVDINIGTWNKPYEVV